MWKASVNDDRSEADICYYCWLNVFATLMLGLVFDESNEHFMYLLPDIWMISTPC
jgi:hypothetical protein